MRVIFKGDELDLLDGLCVHLNHKARSRRRRRDAFRMEYQGAAAGCVVAGSSAPASGYRRTPLPRIPLVFPAACLPSARATWRAGRQIPRHRAAKMNKPSLFLSCHNQTIISWHLLKLKRYSGLQRVGLLVIDSVYFIVSLSTDTIQHRQPASTGTFHDSYRDQGHGKVDIIFVTVFRYDAMEYGGYVPNFRKNRMLPPVG